MTQPASYALRLPISLKKAVTEAAGRDGISINQFITLAVAEKLSAMDAARFFEEKREQADMEAFRNVLNREGGQPPIPGDELTAPDAETA